MPFEQRIQEHVHASLDASAQATDKLAPTIAIASSKIVQCMLEEGKILCCGSGASHLLAQHFSALLLNRYESHFPSLPVLTLDAVSHSALASSHGNSQREMFSGQIRALGHPGDLLLAISSHEDCDATQEAIEAAHDRNLGVIALTGKSNPSSDTSSSERDIEICITSNDPTHIQEAHLLVVHCLSKLIDHQLFGGE